MGTITPRELYLNDAAADRGEPAPIPHCPTCMVRLTAADSVPCGNSECPIPARIERLVAKAECGADWAEIAFLEAFMNGGPFFPAGAL